VPYYENIFIARQDVSAAQVDGLADQFAGIIEENGGKIAKREYWGLKTLAYKIRKNRKGHYVLFNIDAPHAAVNEMERSMRLNEDVLRHLTVRLSALDPEPSVMMRNKGQRDDRGRRGRGPAGDRPAGDRPAGDRPTGDRPAGDRPAGEKASPEKTPAQKPAGESSSPEPKAEGDDA